ncbi:helicase-related protein [Agromyces sp. GXQ0307]|uniref:helicase-related protein n=1 Tax=Agromyces sp. GXQ0307 TaxID=3377835 RepID=UPI00383A1DFE
MSATDVRNEYVDELRRMWLGPLDGPNEVLSRNPVYAYLVGTMYPVEEGAVAAVPTVLDEDIEAGVLHGETAEVVDDELDVGGERPDEDDDPGLSLVGAFGWAPQSMGMSFIHDGDAIIVSVDAGAYREDESAETSGDEPADGPREAWRREDVSQAGIRIPTTAHGRQTTLNGRADLAWRTRIIGEKRLTTIAVSNAETAAAGKAKSDPTKCLFQVRIRADIESGRLHPYPTSNPVTSSDEDRELELRYRSKPTYAIGHGTAVVWDDGDAPGYAMTETIPRQEVPAVRARVSTLQALQLAWLADESVSAADLGTGLRAFLSGYRSWVSDREQEAASLPSRFEKPAAAILERMSTARDRIEDGIRLLESGGSVLTAFRLANRAMRTQMLQQRWARGHAGQIGVPLEPAPEPGPDREPRWHPFQLGFILLSLASTTDDEHEDRELVDLIWFPTGGGKTEAYLGLAAIEMIRRRLDRGVHGGGTAVLTRYTMRLLTAQQFQRAATLICALELLRSEDDRLAGTPSFSIGLWLGNTTTPGTYEQAADQMKRVLREKSPQNPFQFRQCSWCGTSIMPERQSRYEELYGVRATKFSFQFFCPHAECPFHVKLPVQVVDEGIFEDPPTMLVATVDKFARLAWIDQGASMFGLGGVAYDPPSLVIQDELHLIAGPLGTIVGIYEAAIRGLMSWKGTAPKVVASTATTRASADQIRELMASKVSVFPPSGLDADDSYFAEPDPDRAGRMYVGIMPQAHTPSWALGQISTEMLNAPVRLGMTGAELDAYWTLVVYHNSLRELGRTVTILRDDVRAALDRRADRDDDGPSRTLAKDGIEELNGNVSSDELLRILEQLGEGPESGGKPLDALATTNIMSVGIDVSRLGLMLVNGQPKSTSEYIQATSRVGRGDVPGLVVTMYRSGKPRDRSVFESFTAYHRAYYRFVEPGTVTPWSLQARRRALRAALVILVRHGAGLNLNDKASQFDVDASPVKKAVEMLTRHVQVADGREAEKVADELQKALDDWEHRAEDAGLSGTPLMYRSFTAGERLLKQFTDTGAGWSTMNSMRSVDRVVRVRADGER